LEEDVKCGEEEEDGWGKLEKEGEGNGGDESGRSCGRYEWCMMHGGDDDDDDGVV
jgi:hypothetical protein